MKATGYHARLIRFFWECVCEAFHRSWKLKSLVYGVIALIIPALLHLPTDQRIAGFISTLGRYWWLPLAAYLVIIIVAFTDVIFKRYDDVKAQLDKFTDHPVAIVPLADEIVNEATLLQVLVTNSGKTTISGLNLQMTHFSHKEVIKHLNTPLQLPISDTLNPGESDRAILFSCRGTTENVTLSLSLPRSMYELFDLMQPTYEMRLRVTAKDIPAKEQTLWVAVNPPRVHLTDHQPSA